MVLVPLESFLKILSKFVIMAAMATFSVFDRVTAKIKGKTFKSFYLHLNCDWHHLKLFMNCVRWYHKIWIFWLPWKQFPFYLILMCQSLYWWWSRQRPALSGCFSSFITCCFTLVKGMWVFSSLSFFFSIYTGRSYYYCCNNYVAK